MISRLRRPLLLLAAIALGFFYLTAWIGTSPGNIWNSPDETANAFWAERVAEREPLMLRDYAVGIGAGAVHPRSFDVYGTALVPGSFPGIFLIYGGLKFFTGFPLSAMTPILTAIAGLVLFGVFRRLFDEKTAFWSACLFYLHPAAIYYSGRGLFHNMLFIDLAVFAVGLFVLRPFSEGLKSVWWSDDVLAGILFGFAVITRASEAPWLLPAAATLLVFIGKARWKRALAVAVGGLLPLFILLSFNATVYGTLLGSGYVVPAAPIQEESASLAVIEASEAPSALLPFGFHPRLVVRHGMDYGLGIFWWYSLAGVFGLTVFLMRWGTIDAKRKTYLFVTAAVTAWLLIFYGSWYVRDHFDPTQITIGTSYVRYFLPIYVLTLPWVVEGLMWAAGRLRLGGRRGMIAFAVLFLVLSLRVAVTEGDESLLAVRATLRGNLEKRAALKQVIPSDSVVMTERFDKVLFPDRMRIIPLTDEASFAAVPVLMTAMPVYWYGVEPGETEFERLSRMAADAGVELKRLDSPIEGEALFQFTETVTESDETAS